MGNSSKLTISNVVDLWRKYKNVFKNEETPINSEEACQLVNTTLNFMFNGDLEDRKILVCRSTPNSAPIVHLLEFMCSLFVPGADLNDHSIFAIKHRSSTAGWIISNQEIDCLKTSQNECEYSISKLLEISISAWLSKNTTEVGPNGVKFKAYESTDAKALEYVGLYMIMGLCMMSSESFNFLSEIHSSIMIQVLENLNTKRKSWSEGTAATYPKFLPRIWKTLKYMHDDTFHKLQTIVLFTSLKTTNWNIQEKSLLIEYFVESSFRESVTLKQMEKSLSFIIKQYKSIALPDYIYRFSLILYVKVNVNSTLLPINIELFNAAVNRTVTLIKEELKKRQSIDAVKVLKHKLAEYLIQFAGIFTYSPKIRLDICITSLSLYENGEDFIKSTKAVKFLKGSDENENLELDTKLMSEFVKSIAKLRPPTFQYNLKAPEFIYLAQCGITNLNVESSF